MRKAGLSLKQIAQRVGHHHSLCMLVLVNISLQVFLSDSQHISDDFGLILQIATDGATTLFSKQ
jgi:hypothetical protein